jgi:hypothetical protein
LKLLGFTTPFVYAAATFGFFHYLDGKVSDEAQKAISGWLQPKEYDKVTVARAIVEIFDRVYTRPLLGYRALLRSVSFTLVLFVIFLYEIDKLKLFVEEFYSKYEKMEKFSLAMLLGTNMLRDYISLFIVRRWLVIGSRRIGSISVRFSCGIGYHCRFVCPPRQSHLAVFRFFCRAYLRP